ncbi:MAG: ABC transporter ATP-binding protein [Bryobacteraceae bacterium]|nr:ABC transporter ATP-binding protein [Bryobacteraceae bacterium]
MIRCLSLAKRYGALTAVNDVSLEIRRGEVCAILGPNGAGKSTLIRMLCGLTVPDAGSVSIAGFDPWKQPGPLRRAIGVVPENLALLPELSLEEQLFLSGPIYGLSKLQTRQRSDELLHFFGLDDKRRTLARQGSHGMRKKTALAMALLHNPSVLILDEPFEGIDPVSAETIGMLLRAVSSRGITILLTSHILSMVDRISDRVMLIRQGSLVWNSTVQELPETAERLYFHLVESPAFRDLEWLHSPQSQAR